MSLPPAATPADPAAAVGTQEQDALDPFGDVTFDIADDLAALFRGDSPNRALPQPQQPTGYQAPACLQLAMDALAQARSPADVEAARHLAAGHWLGNATPG